MPYKDPQKQKEAQKNYYLANRDNEIRAAYERKLNHQRKLKEIVATAKNVPCAECGGRFHQVAMDFHHIEEKDDCIANMIKRNLSAKRVLAEIMKCEVICSNCHRVRSWVTDIAD